MTLRPVFGALAAALLLSVTACGPLGVTPETANTQVQRDPDEWVNQQFSGGKWGPPGVYRAGGGIGGPGDETGLEFTPAKPGWYRIGMVCEGASSMTVTATASGEALGTGSTDCGSEVTTTMELPASKVMIAVEGAEAQGMWALAVAPTEAP
ncbi:hypothetical protein [Arthrobacter sp. NPDC089319]|uniref:hypothetical protein n=1 Tax=Arthrobacter sp. NPDC089319 TaxID=3155915 RepID=UPI00341473C3